LVQGICGKKQRATNCVSVSLAAVSTLIQRVKYSGPLIDNPELFVFRVVPSYPSTNQITWIENPVLDKYGDHFICGPYATELKEHSQALSELELNDIQLSQESENGIPMFSSLNGKGGFAFFFFYPVAFIDDVKAERWNQENKTLLGILAYTTISFNTFHCMVFISDHSDQVLNQSTFPYSYRG
jgi:hypothetical protein